MTPTANDGDKAGRATPRPQTPHAHALLKTVRYEEVGSGTPPLPIATAAQHKPPHIIPANVRSEMLPPPPPLAAGRPKTAPSARSNRASHFSDDVKRDSGFAASPTTAGRESYAESHQSSVTGPNVAKVVTNLPAIAANEQEDQPAAAIERPSIEHRRPRSPFVRRRSKKLSQKNKSESPPAVPRIQSFQGIQTSIPTGSLDDLDTDNIGFSKRGSIFFGGKKMEDLLRSTSVRKKTTTTPTTAAKGEDESIAAVADGSTQPSIDQSAPKAGLVARRRKPSVHMLQAAIEGGRVLSAEEIGFSMKVRSMYQAGDEEAVDWSVPNGAPTRNTPETVQTEGSAQNPVADSPLVVGKSRQSNPLPQSRQSQDVAANYRINRTHELAGGIEDWADIKGGDVDRYGFIVPKRPEDRPASGSSPLPADGLHRVATGLRLAADQPRRRGLRRIPSTSRSSKSLPARSHRPSSIHSFNSASGASSLRAGAFRSKERRITASAGNMLTLPPGLADIAEHEDGGRTVDAQRRREWSRNEKWQRMAQPVKNNIHDNGGGMRFDFDTSDPKLISRTWKGIPDRWRATAWHSFLSASARKRSDKYASDEVLIKEYSSLQESNCADDYQIDVDVPRTISMHVMFRRRYRGGQRLLFRVLHAISLYFPETGYVQGMASLAATLLCYYDEEHAFVMMVRLWQLRGLEQLFQPGFNGLMAALKQFEDRWLAGGDVAQKLNELTISSTAYGTRWYLTLFNMSIPFPSQLRVWDVFMLLGDASPTGSGVFGGADLDVLHATSAALIDATREIILDSDFENAMKILTSFVPIRDEDLLMRVARAELKMSKKRNAGASVAKNAATVGNGEAPVDAEKS